MVFEGATLQGSMHEDYHVANQDAYALEQIDDYYAAVVCDGVSLKSDHTFSSSEIASQFCAQFVMKYLREHLYRHMEDSQTENVLFECFKAVAKGLQEELDQREIPFYDCQTTVLVMLEHKGTLYAALAGDGGLIFETKDGTYGVLITKIKTSASVEPICYPPGWRFSVVEAGDNPVDKVIMATDGIFDNLCQSFRGELTLNMPVIDELFSIQDVTEGHQQRALSEILKHIETHDDKTAVVWIDDAAQPDASPAGSDQPDHLSGENEPAQQADSQSEADQGPAFRQ